MKIDVFALKMVQNHFNIHFLNIYKTRNAGVSNQPNAQHSIKYNY